MLSVEKVPKVAGVDKATEKDPKKFHYVYVLKKQGSALPPPKPVDEQAKEDKEDCQ